MTENKIKTIRLKKKDERRVLRGHPWIFSNEIQNVPPDASPGEIVDILDYSGGFIGRGYINPHTLIAVRILTKKREAIDDRFLLKRISAARDLRMKLDVGQSFRAFYSEGDGIPGLIVDKYGDVLAVQSLTAGIERLLESLLPVLGQVYNPQAIVLKNDTASRSLEGLPRETRVAHGSVAGPVMMEESGIKYMIDLLEGQKTGFFFDQRENRLALNNIVRKKRTLDCFCYVGAWALSAARFGASEVIGIDSSEKAIQSAIGNASLNNLSARFLVGDIFEELEKFEKKNEQFGCIILDPPAFVKSRTKLREGLKGYKEINKRAMNLLEPGGVLVSCSCSHHVDSELFREMLIDAAYSAKKNLRLLEMRSQARDHPVVLAARETQYLKCAILIVE